jgi:hypothetical protein
MHRLYGSNFLNNQSSFPATVRTPSPACGGSIGGLWPPFFKMTPMQSIGYGWGCRRIRTADRAHNRAANSAYAAIALSAVAADA